MFCHWNKKQIHTDDYKRQRHGLNAITLNVYFGDFNFYQATHKVRLDEVTIVHSNLRLPRTRGFHRLQKSQLNMTQVSRFWSTALRAEMTLDTSTNRSRIENLSSEHNLRGVSKSSAIPFFLGSYYEFNTKDQPRPFLWSNLKYIQHWKGVQSSYTALFTM